MLWTDFPCNLCQFWSLPISCRAVCGMHCLGSTITHECANLAILCLSNTPITGSGLHIEANIFDAWPLQPANATCYCGTYTSGQTMPDRLLMVMPFDLPFILRFMLALTTNVSTNTYNPWTPTNLSCTCSVCTFDWLGSYGVREFSSKTCDVGSVNGLHIMLVSSC
jgi:hypothetical protein